MHFEIGTRTFNNKKVIFRGITVLIAIDANRKILLHIDTEMLFSYVLIPFVIQRFLVLVNCKHITPIRKHTSDKLLRNDYAETPVSESYEDDIADSFKNDEGQSEFSENEAQFLNGDYDSNLGNDDDEAKSLYKGTLLNKFDDSAKLLHNSEEDINHSSGSRELNNCSLNRVQQNDKIPMNMSPSQNRQSQYQSQSQSQLQPQLQSQHKSQSQSQLHSQLQSQPQSHSKSQLQWWSRGLEDKPGLGIIKQSSSLEAKLSKAQNLSNVGLGSELVASDEYETSSESTDDEYDDEEEMGSEIPLPNENFKEQKPFLGKNPICLNNYSYSNLNKNSQSYPHLQCGSNSHSHSYSYSDSRGLGDKLGLGINKLSGSVAKPSKEQNLCFGLGDKPWLENTQSSGLEAKPSMDQNLNFGLGSEPVTSDEDENGSAGTDDEDTVNMKSRKQEEYEKNVPIDYDQVNDTGDLSEMSKECPKQCPASTGMVCARCQHQVYSSFLSICHVRMYSCKYPEDKLELVSRQACAFSGPMDVEGGEPHGRVKEPGYDDTVLHFIHCRNKEQIGKENLEKKGTGPKVMRPWHILSSNTFKFHLKSSRYH